MGEHPPFEKTPETNPRENDDNLVQIVDGLLESGDHVAIRQALEQMKPQRTNSELEEKLGVLAEQCKNYTKIRKEIDRINSELHGLREKESERIKKEDDKERSALVREKAHLQMLQKQLEALPHILDGASLIFFENEVEGEKGMVTTAGYESNLKSGDTKKLSESNETMELKGWDRELTTEHHTKQISSPSEELVKLWNGPKFSAEKIERTLTQGQIEYLKRKVEEERVSLVAYIAATEEKIDLLAKKVGRE